MSLSEPSPETWKSFVISMNPSGKRYEYFRYNNSHLNYDIFKAVDGRSLNLKELVNNGLITEELSSSPLLTKGTVGCAESHRSLWRKSVNENINLLIFEDDCYTHPKLEDFITARLQMLKKIDICLFGINTDVDFHSISPQGLMSTTYFRPKYPNEAWILNALQRTNPKKVIFHKLLRGAGTCAYFITPTGAKKMLSGIFPLSLEHKEPYKTILPFSIDRSASKIYNKISAVVCIPFMAYTSNNDSTTISQINT